MRNIKDIEQSMKAQAENQSFNYDGAYWDDVSNMLDANATGFSNTEKVGAESDSAYTTETSNQSFEFKESYWTEMNAVLDKAERRAGFMLWSKMMGAAALVGVIGLISYNAVQGDSKISDLAASLDQNSGFERMELGERDELDEIQTAKVISESNLENFSDIVISDRRTQRNFDGSEEIVSYKNEFRNEVIANKNLDTKTGAEQNVESGTSDVTIEEIELSKLSIPTLQASNQEVSQVSFSNIFINKRARNSSFSIHAGGLLANAPNSSEEGNQRIGYGFRGGISYQFNRNKWGLETGLNFIYRTGLNQRLNQNSLRYGMTVFREQNQTNYKSMMSLEVPLMATVQLKRHRIGLGFTGVYNFAVNSTLVRSNNISDLEEVVRNNYANAEGMRKFDARVQANYEFKINKRFDVGLNAQYGLINQVDRTVVTNSDGYNELNASVYLKFNILNF